MFNKRDNEYVAFKIKMLFSYFLHIIQSFFEIIICVHDYEYDRLYGGMPYKGKYFYKSCKKCDKYKLINDEEYNINKHDNQSKENNSKK